MGWEVSFLMLRLENRAHEYTTQLSEAYWMIASGGESNVQHHQLSILNFARFQQQHTLQ